MTRRGFLLGLLLIFSASAPAGEEVRILFVGNSYTAGMRGTFTAMAGQLKDPQVKPDFVIKNGCTLARHLDDASMGPKIENGKWTYVVLQEQSQLPSLGGEAEASFHESVKKFATLIRASGAKPVLFMTWGRRDGDKANAHLNPDYETMQKRLTAAYAKAAKDNDCLLVPAGEVWAAVRKADPELGKALYSKDGSHPAAKGAYLISSVFLKVLLNVPLENLPANKSVTEAEAATVVKAIQDATASK